MRMFPCLICSWYHEIYQILRRIKKLIKFTPVELKCLHVFNFIIPEENFLGFRKNTFSVRARVDCGFRWYSHCQKLNHLILSYLIHYVTIFLSNLSNKSWDKLLRFIKVRRWSSFKAPVANIKFNGGANGSCFCCFLRCAQSLGVQRSCAIKSIKLFHFNMRI